ncbi:MAG: hypothetical protein WC444_06140 [Candidatus Paceibacterota bacterium]
MYGEQKTDNTPEPEIGNKGYSTGLTLNRASKADLEALYISDPVIFNGINTYYKTILSNPPTLTNGSEKDQKKLDQFSKQIKLQRSIIPSITQHSLIYGTAWNEKIYNKAPRGNILHKILGIPTRDPKLMDFLRHQNTNYIRFNEVGEPEGYCQYIADGIHYEGTDTIINGTNSLKAIPFTPNKIMWTNYIAVGDTYEGIGLVEPILNSSLDKNNAQKGFSAYIYRLGHGLLGIKAGNERFIPSTDMIHKAIQIFSNINTETVVSYPYYLQPEMIEPKRGIERLREQVDYFIDQQIAGIGLPACLVTGQGTSMNRSILDKMMMLFYQSLTMIQNNISISIEDNLSQELMDIYGLDNPPRLEWPDINIESMDSKANRLSTYAKAGLLGATPMLQTYIRHSEHLPQEGDNTPNTPDTQSNEDQENHKSKLDSILDF